MIWADRPRPWARLVEYRLEADTLVRVSPPKTFALAGLRAVRLYRGDGRLAPDALVVRLSFAKGGLSLTSLSFEQRLAPQDRTAELSAFTRALLDRASTLAPGARYETGRSSAPGLFLGAAAILGAGILLALLATLTSGLPGMGVEFAARLFFILLLMGAAWPWVGGLSVTRFDPRSPPPALLP